MVPGAHRKKLSQHRGGREGGGEEQQGREVGTGEENRSFLGTIEKIIFTRQIGPRRLIFVSALYLTSQHLGSHTHPSDQLLP